MPGMRGEEEEQPASKSAVFEENSQYLFMMMTIIVSLPHSSLSSNSHNKIIAKAINIINT